MKTVIAKGWTLKLQTSNFLYPYSYCLSCSVPQENSLFSHSLKQLDVVVHKCNPSSWEAEVKVHRLLSEFKATLG